MVFRKSDLSYTIEVRYNALRNKKQKQKCVLYTNCAQQKLFINAGKQEFSIKQSNNTKF